MPAGRKHLSSVHEHFIYWRIQSTNMNVRNASTVRSTKSKSTTQEAKHLEECLSYILWTEEQDRPTKKQRRLGDTIAIRIPSVRKA
jgi:hypothetical protein